MEIEVRSPSLTIDIALEYTKLDLITPEALFLIIPEKYEKCN
jgi:hypothetical protein